MKSIMGHFRWDLVIPFRRWKLKEFSTFTVEGYGKGRTTFNRSLVYSALQSPLPLSYLLFPNLWSVHFAKCVQTNTPTHTATNAKC